MKNLMRISENSSWKSIASSVLQEKIKIFHQKYIKKSLDKKKIFQSIYFFYFN